MKVAKRADLKSSLHKMSGEMHIVCIWVNIFSKIIMVVSIMPTFINTIPIKILAGFLAAIDI